MYRLRVASALGKLGTNNKLGPSSGHVPRNSQWRRTPRDRHAGKCGNEFSPSDLDCQTDPPVGVVTMQWRGPYHALMAQSETNSGSEDGGRQLRLSSSTRSECEPPAWQPRVVARGMGMSQKSLKQTPRPNCQRGDHKEAGRQIDAALPKVGGRPRNPWGRSSEAATLRLRQPVTIGRSLSQLTMRAHSSIGAMRYGSQSVQ